MHSTVSSTVRKRSLIAILSIAMAMTVAGTGQAQEIVEVGYDLFQTQSGTQFRFPCSETELQAVELKGLPLGTFDFGGATGERDVGTTDTIVLRKERAVEDPTTGADVVAIEIVALSLVSRGPISLCGGPEEEIFVTLNEERMADLTDTGQMEIHFDPDKFFTTPAGLGPPDPRLLVWFDVSGSVSGPIATLDKRFRITNDPEWRRTPPSNAVLIDGVNHRLNGVDESADFFPVGSVIEDAPPRNWHRVRTATETFQGPALTPWGVAALAALLALSLAWGLRRRSARRPL